MENNFDINTLPNLKYHELRKIAKGFGIRANMKSDRLIKAIQDYVSSHASTSLPQANVPTSSESVSDESSESNEAKADKAACDEHNDKKTTSQLECAVKSSPIKSSAKKMTPARLSTPKAVPTTKSLMTLKQATPVRSPVAKTPTGRIKSISTHSPLPKKAVLHRHGNSLTKRASKSPKAVKKGSAKKSPVAGGSAQGKRKNSRGSSTAKSPGGRKRSATPTAGVGEKRKRRTYSMERASPSVEHMLNSMKEGMNDEERKESLMKALDEVSAKKRKIEPETHTTQIPRFTGLSTAQNAPKKTTTPGKDWSRIHERQFSKMASLDEYLARKRQRTASLTASLRKLQDKAKGMETKLDSLKKPQQKAGAKARTSKTALNFQSPAPTSFKPSVTSASKVKVNFTGSSVKSVVFKGRTSAHKMMSAKKETPKTNLSAPKTPKAVEKTPGKENQKKALSQSQTKTASTRSLVGTASLNTTKSAAQKFDLQASLQKKMTWTPYTGQVKPFVESNPYNTTSQVLDIKTRPAKTKAARRAEAQSHRANKRNQAQMQRRGLSAQ